MLAYMLDTNICIYVMRRREQALLDRFSATAGRTCLSSIVVSELQFGARKSRWQEASLELLRSFISQLDVLSYGIEAAGHYAEIRNALEVAGVPAGPNDLLIGAHARSLDLTLVTNNRREFDRMPGLRVENWV